MSKLIERIKALLPIFKSQEAVEEAYLCEAVDVSDLERRIRIVDNDRSNAARGMALSALMP